MTGMVAETPWPKAEESFLARDHVTIAVQVNGKRRDEIRVPKGLGRQERRRGGAGARQRQARARRQAGAKGDRRAGSYRQCGERMTMRELQRMVGRHVLLVAVAPGCSDFRPLYGTTDESSTCRRRTRAVAIPEPETRLGQLIRNDLMSSMRPAGTAAARPLHARHRRSSRRRRRRSNRRPSTVSCAVP